MTHAPNPALSWRHQHQMVKPDRPRFSGGSSVHGVLSKPENLLNATVKQSARPIAEIRNLKVAQKAYEIFKSFGITRIVGINGFSPEDVVSRASCIPLYAMQQIGAAITHQHFFETVGRNAVTWWLQVAGTTIVKDDKGPFVGFLGRFMEPKKSLDQKAPWQEKLVNRFRPDIDFRSLLEEAGLKQEKSPLFWAKTDQNENAALDGLFKDTQQKAIEALPPPVRALYEKLPKSKRLTFLQDALQKHAPHALSQKEKHFLEMIPKYLTKWRSTMNLAKSAAMITMYTFVGGQLAMWIVYKTIARLDPDFEPNKKPAKATPSSVKPAPSRVPPHTIPQDQYASAVMTPSWSMPPLGSYAYPATPLPSLTTAFSSMPQFSKTFSSQGVLPMISGVASPTLMSPFAPQDFQGRRL